MKLDKTTEENVQGEGLHQALAEYVNTVLPEGSAGAVLANKVRKLRNDPALRESDVLSGLNHTMHCNLGEAVRSLLGRPEMNYDIAALFDPQAAHIKQIRGLIAVAHQRMQGDGEAQLAADRVEQALNNVQSLSSSRGFSGRNGKNFSISLSAHNSVNAHGSSAGGLIAEEYGDKEKGHYEGDARILIPSEWFIHNMKETNAYDDYFGGMKGKNSGNVDIVVVMRDGSQYTINMWSEKSRNLDKINAWLETREEGRDLPEIDKARTAEYDAEREKIMGDKSRSALQKAQAIEGLALPPRALSEEQAQKADDLLKKLLPGLAEAFPGRVNTQGVGMKI